MTAFIVLLPFVFSSYLKLVKQWESPEANPPLVTPTCIALTVYQEACTRHMPATRGELHCQLLDLHTGKQNEHADTCSLPPLFVTGHQTIIVGDALDRKSYVKV